MSKQKIICIRHAESCYNVERTQLNFNKFSLDLVDSPLTNKGMQQCSQLRDEMSKILPEVKLVFVSPLRRALQTTKELFKQVKQQPWIVVLPELSEILRSANDVGQVFNEVESEYNQFDFEQVKMASENNYGMWNIHNIIQSKQYGLLNLLDSYHQKSKNNIGSNSSAKKNNLDKLQKEQIILRQMNVQVIESNQEFKQRAQRAKDKMKEMIDNATNGSNSGIILIVSHARILSEFIPQKLNLCQSKECINFNLQ